MSCSDGSGVSGPTCLWGPYLGAGPSCPCPVTFSCPTATWGSQVGAALGAGSRPTMASAGRWGGAPQGQALGIQADLLPVPLCPLPHLPPALSQCLAPAPSPRSWHPPLSVTPEGTASVCCLLPPLSPHPPPLPRDPPSPSLCLLRVKPPSSTLRLLETLPSAPKPSSRHSGPMPGPQGPLQGRWFMVPSAKIARPPSSLSHQLPGLGSTEYLINV